jgi:hypothetical protein
MRGYAGKERLEAKLACVKAVEMPFLLIPLVSGSEHLSSKSKR